MKVETLGWPLGTSIITKPSDTTARAHSPSSSSSARLHGPLHTQTHTNITEKLWILALAIPKNDCKLLRPTGSINLPRTRTLPLQCLDKIMLKYSFSLSANTMFLIYARKVHFSLRSHSSAAHSSTVVLVTLESKTDTNALLEKNNLFLKESLFCPWQCLQTG